MNTELFITLIAALALYRVCAPLIDRINPLNAGVRSASAGGAAASRGGLVEVGRQPDPRGGETLTLQSRTSATRNPSV
ncbi:MAG: hypothetical protein E6Q40_07600 [Cupriavidus sp.]|nr:MAG: hypothetical protein E6Q40_07600 [Cupriavidus sp.]